jgi:site-specific DNA-methyltransferase (adenine-specific)
MAIPPSWRDRCTLYQADYRTTLARAADQGGADLVFTSPPYCDARTYGAAVSWTDADYASLGDAVFGALKPGGHALINVDAPVREWRKGYGSERGFHPWKLMIDWAERVGFRVVDRLGFGRLGLPGEYRGRLRNDWEPLLWFQRPGAAGWFDKWALVRPVRGHRGGRNVSSRKDGTRRIRRPTGKAHDAGVSHRGTFWSYGSVGKGHTGAPDIEAANHPARWPYRLAEDIVCCFCPPDGLAVDPFVGAGTSAVAALEHGRRFVGGDLYGNNDGTPWVDVAEGIIEARSQQIALFGS